ncbi:MAG TPA: Virginiamycin B lyase [Thermoanaerobaculia bacterium]
MLAADGNLCFTESDANQIGSVSPGGEFVEYPLPPSSCGPGSLAVVPGGDIWYTRGCYGGLAGNFPAPVTVVGVLSRSGSATELVVSALPTDIALGPDGNLWIAAGTIGRVTPAGAVAYFSPPATGGTIDFYPMGITAGPDGNLWFTEIGSPRVGKISVSGVITEYDLPSADLRPEFICAGADGNLWFTATNKDRTQDSIGRVTTSGQVTLFPVCTPSIGYSRITSGPDGNLWFTEPGTGDGGTVWNRLVRMDPDGAITEFVSPTVDSRPNGIAAGPDGNVWFTEIAGSAIGRVDLDSLEGGGNIHAESCRRVLLSQSRPGPPNVIPLR